MPSKPSTMTRAFDAASPRPLQPGPTAASSAIAITAAAKRAGPGGEEGGLLKGRRPSQTGAFHPCAPAARAQTGGEQTVRCRPAPGPPIRSSAREEDAGNQAGVDTVIPAPRLHVVLEDGAGYDPCGQIPRGAIAPIVPDQEVGRVREVGACVELRGVEDLSDADLALLRVHEPVELGDDLRLQGL